jgi:hypothetical protein
VQGGSISTLCLGCKESAAFPLKSGNSSQSIFDVIIGAHRPRHLGYLDQSHMGILSTCSKPSNPRFP